MPRNADDVENFLYQLNRTFERDGDTFVVSNGVEQPPMIMVVASPVVVIRTAIGPIPKDAALQNKLMRRLLRYNCSELVHATYALEEDDSIVLTAGLELENVDLNEISAVLSDIELALARHVSTLLSLATGEGTAAAAAKDGDAASA